MGSAVTPDLSKGGEIDGDLTITGDFKVEGAGSFAYDEILQGDLQIVKDDGTLLMQSASVNNSTFFRMAEDGFQGGFIEYDGSNNLFKIGTHNASDSNASNDIDVITITRDGTAVGINTTSPSGAKLQIAQSADSQGLKITGYDDRNDKHANLHITSGGDFDITASGHVSINGGGNIYMYDYLMVQDRITKTGAGTLQFGGTYDVDLHFLGTSDAVVMAIDNGNKRVGIGTVSPSKPLHIKVNNNDTDPHFFIENAHNGGRSHMRFYNSSRNTSWAIGQDNDDTFVIANSASVTANERLVLDSNSRISLSNNDSGTDNTIFGKEAGNSIASGGNYNTTIGRASGKLLTTGDQNSYIGTYAGLFNVTGSSNTAIGYNSQYGASGQSHSNNTSVGKDSLKAITTAEDNTAVGLQSGELMTSGHSNTLLGNATGRLMTTTANTVLVGLGAGYAINSTDANGTVAVGRFALNALTNGQYNTAIGYEALKTEDTGNFNTAVGYQALTSQNRDGTVNNTAVGYKAGYAVTDGWSATLIGSNAGVALTTGFNTTIVGANSGASLTTGDYNTAIGADALVNEDVGRGSTAIGYNALRQQNSDSNDEVTYNVGVGFQAGYNNITGTHNTFVGSHSAVGTGNMGSNNTTLGALTLNALTTGTANVAIGTESAKSLTVETGNISIGAGAMSAVAKGSAGNQYTNHNIAIGQNAMTGGVPSSGSFEYNIAIGNNALNSTGTSVGTSGTIAIGHDALTALTSGTLNTAVGYEAGKTMTTATNNSFFGYQSGHLATGGGNAGFGGSALYVLAGGTNNSAFGSQSHQNLTSGGNNTAVGHASGYGVTTGSDNVNIGKYTSFYNQAGSDNIAIGTSSMQGSSNYNSSSCVAIGYHTLINFTGQGTGTIAVGFKALNALTSGTSNTAIGYQSGLALTTSGNNVALGYNSLLSAVDGCNSNVAIGVQSMRYVDRGSDGSATVNGNIALGYNALAGGDFGSSDKDLVGNIAIGKNALDATGANAQTGTIAIGHEALTALTSGAYNTAVGYLSGQYITTGDGNTSLGYKALSGSAGTDDNNVAIGYQAMDASSGTGGGQNVFMGKNTGGGTWTTGACNYNVGIGSEALAGALAVNSGIIGIGYKALNALTSGTKNTAIGYQALKEHQTQNNNTVLGYNVASNTNNSHCADNTFIGTNTANGSWAGTARYNTAVGMESMYGDMNGAEYNTALGHSALRAITSGDNNVGLGNNAGEAITTGSNNVIIGYDSEASGVGASNQIVIGASTTGLGDNYAVIGNANITRLYVASDGAGVLYANGTIQTSDERLKENIEDSDLGLEFINKIRPVSYNYINDKQDGKTKYGIIAQEVQEVLKESNNEDFAGIKDSDEYLGADYNQFISPLIKAVQELSAEVKQLKQQLEDK